jgi:hypothetical protein
MAFPEINYCLICEEIRSERGNKLTILGYYGISPDVNILVKELGKEIRVLFLVGISKGSGEYTVIPRILNPDDTRHIGELSAVIHLDENAPMTAFGFGLPLIPKQEGTYLFQLVIKGKEVYRAPFNVRKGEASEF